MAGKAETHLNDVSVPRRHIDWSTNSKHFFILSDAGKPIFSRYGEEDVKLIPLMGVASLLMARTNDKMRCIVAGRYRLVFLSRSPVYLFAVSRTGESVAHLRQQLQHLFAQMLFVVTTRGFAILKKNASYDMRGVLKGIRQPLLSLIHTANSTSSLLLEAVPTIPLLPGVRAAANSILRAEKCPELAFAILLSGFQLVTLVQLKNNPIHPADLLVLMNFVNTNRSLRDNETWLPICLPNLNSSGFLNSYISFLGDGNSGNATRDMKASNSGRSGSSGGSSLGVRQNSISLMLIATDNALDVFHKFSESKARIEAKLREQKIVDAIRKSERQAKFTTADIGVPQAFHFIFVNGRSSSVPQYCSTSLSVAPYLDKDSQKRLLRRYQEIYHRAHGCLRDGAGVYCAGANRKPRASGGSIVDGEVVPLTPHNLFVNMGQKESIVGFIGKDFEVYAVLSPLAFMPLIVDCLDRIIIWSKRKEKTLFALDKDTW